MPDPVVLYEMDDKVSVITLNRPDKLNAISPELRLQLTDAFTRADADPATSVVLLRAEGRASAPATTSRRGSPGRMIGAAIRPKRTTTCTPS
jgi:enoyl-CoA hydratase/carnithine racemase